MTHIICIRELNYYWSRYHLLQFDNHVISILGLILIQWARVIFYWNETELQTFSDATLLKHSPREKRLASWQYKLYNMSSWTRLNAQSLDTDVQRPFYFVATVALLPYYRETGTAKGEGGGEGGDLSRATVIKWPVVHGISRNPLHVFDHSEMQCFVPS